MKTVSYSNGLVRIAFEERLLNDLKTYHANDDVTTKEELIGQLREEVGEFMNDLEEILGCLVTELLEEMIGEIAAKQQEQAIYWQTITPTTDQAHENGRGKPFCTTI